MKNTAINKVQNQELQNPDNVSEGRSHQEDVVITNPSYNKTNSTL